jgi:hypothetical protein
VTLLACWLAFPALLIALSVGCGLLVERVAGVELPGGLVPGVGLAAIVVVAGFTTIADATAELTAPMVVALAVAGLALSLPWRLRRPDWWLVVAAVGVFLVYAAPIVLSGKPTFAGYIKLDDTASWVGITDRLMTHGRSLAGLAPSSYQAMLHFYVDSDYPVGSFLPLGIGHVLTGQDSLFLYQPYLAVLALMLSCALYELSRPLFASRARRAAAVFVASQSALLFGYTMWGGVKELATAWLVALLAALLVPAVRRQSPLRRLVAPAVVVAATLGALSYAGGVWLAPPLVVAAVVLFRRERRDLTVRKIGLFAAIALPLSVPALLLVKFLSEPAASTITTQSRLANLIQPLSPFQVVGIWPVDDFRLRSPYTAVTAVLIAFAMAVALFGVYTAWRRRAWTALLYIGGVGLTGAAVYLVASPWVDAKALAITSPAVLLAAAAGVSALMDERRLAPAAPVLAVAIGGGVLWSNVLAYGGVNLGPYGRLAELERIGHEIAGQGPTLMTDYEPYGVRHLLRNADPEGASELRRRQIPLQNGRLLDKGESADIDEFETSAVLVYRTLVLRRSPVGSRPPEPYHLVSSGHWYDVWQRDAEPSPHVITHETLGDDVNSGAVPACADVLSLAHQAGAGGRLAAVQSSPADLITIRSMRYPSSWTAPTRGVNYVLPNSSGTATTVTTLFTDGRYGVWIGGSFRGRVEIDVDGVSAGSTRNQLSHGGSYAELGSLALRPGRHTVTLRYSRGFFHPGNAGDVFPLGPIVLSRETADRPVFYVQPSQARSLCGQRLDWIEAVSG